MHEEYDLVCIGAGPGGYTAAIRASQFGKRVAVVEISQERVGGTCLNEGCIPVKSIIRSSQLYSMVHPHTNNIGVGVKRDMKDIVADSKRVAFQLRNGVLYLFKKNNITLIEGRARLLERNRIRVELPDGGKKDIIAEFMVLATGSRSQSIPGLEFDGDRIISSTDAINLEEIPKDILIIGGGTVGVEFANLFRNFGVEVTLVEMMERILPHEDEEISRRLEHILGRRGIKIMTRTEMERKDIESELLLVAIGRIPNTDELGLSEVGIELDKGFVKVDNLMRASQKNIFAVGDMIGSPMFAHTAYEEAVVASECICGLNPEPIDYLNIPRVVYGDVEVASVGLAEREAKEKGYKVKVSKQFFKTNSRSVINQQTEGFVKIVADEETHRFLGVHILGHEAGELIHTFIVAKGGGLLVDDVARMVFAHPTVSETAKDACKAVFGKPIHG